LPISFCGNGNPIGVEWAYIGTSEDEKALWELHPVLASGVIISVETNVKE
jgi:hypothetical protein